MGQHHALQQARRAAGERQHGEVGARVDSGRARVAAAGRERLERVDVVQTGAGNGAAQRLRHDRRSRARRRELRGDLARRELRVDRRDDRAERDDRVERGRPGGRVGSEQADGVAGADPIRRQARGGPRDLVGELRVRRDRARRAVDQRRLVAPRGRAPDDVLRQRDVRDVDRRIRAAQDRHAATLERARAGYRESAGGGGVDAT